MKQIITVLILMLSISQKCYPNPKSNMQEIFEKIYADKIWGEGYLSSGLGGSGGGSTIEGTQDVRDYIIDFLKNHPEVQTFLDVGCGEAVWQMLIPWEELGVKYIGIDVVEKLILINQEKMADRPNVEFIYIDGFTERLPNADICFVKDVLQHWGIPDVLSFVNSIRKDYPYFMTINGKVHLDISKINIGSHQFIRNFTDSNELKELYFINP